MAIKDIELPRKVLVGENALYEIDALVSELGFTKKPLVICDEITKEVAGDIVCSELEVDATLSRFSSPEEVFDFEKLVSRKKLGYVVGVGGGRILDTGKLVAFKTQKPFISVPTSASHDGIASPQVSLKQDKPVSVRVHSPTGVLCDTRVIAKSPKRLLASGAADAISNYTAVLDWKLAHEKTGEYFGDYAAALAGMSAEIVMENAGKVVDDVSMLVEALISSGVAIGIAGSSRPCSGSEHLFSHTLDLICEKPALHGEQCGVGTIMMAYLHKAEWRGVRDALKKCGAPTTAKELGITDEKILEALMKAHGMRDRYTILGSGLSRNGAEKVAKETGVI